jgi:hypothetical protein
VTLAPATADILIKVGAGVDVGVVGVEVIENLGCGVYAFGRLAERLSSSAQGSFVDGLIWDKLAIFCYGNKRHSLLRRWIPNTEAPITAAHVFQPRRRVLCR